jgi:uncharacterized protein
MTDSNSSQNLPHPITSVVLTIFLAILGFQVVGPFLGALVAYPFYDGTPAEYQEALSHIGKDPKLRTPLLIIQGVGAAFGLILVPLVLLKKLKRSVSDFFDNDSFHIQPALLVIILVVVFMGFNSLFIEWNQSIELPGAFGEWARSTEDYLEEMTKFFTVFNTTGELVLALFVMAIIPAVGEELVFRGLVQNDLLRATRNPHVAIWISAILFSAVHMQFFGFIPRMFLGALFGYLYHWSGNLAMPMLAHFVNNGFSLIMMYMYQQGATTLDLETPEKAPWKVIIISTILSAFLLYAYRTFYLKHAHTEITNS